MKKKEQIKHLEKEWKNLELQFDNFIKTGDQEALHKFRVQVKKLRAFLTLIEDSTDKTGLLKLFNPVKKIFKNAGIIRDAYINLQLSTEYNLQSEIFEARQRQVMEDGATEFRNNGKAFAREIAVAYKALKKELTPLSNKSIISYYNRQLEQIAMNFTTPGFNEDMHTNRKLIKILIYNHKFAAPVINARLSFNVDYLDKLQDAIGQWHDNAITIDLLTSEEINEKVVAAQIRKINTRVKRTIRNLISHFYQKVTVNSATKVALA